MPLKISQNGATLLELMLAVVMLIGAVVVVSIFFPRASQNITNNRRRALANHLAVARLQELKEEPYPLVPLTDPTLFSVNNLNPGSCDCNVDMFSMPVDTPTYVEDGITYTRQICINLVDRNPTWTSYCPDTPLTPNQDKGLKNIRVRVTWIAGGNTYSVDAESLVTR